MRLVVFLYNLFIRAYVFGIRIAALWNPKAKEWLRGRRNMFDDLAKQIKPEDRIIWMHCASAGEFEQGKPLIEELKQRYPSVKILVSFFSPSGYAVGKKYPHADIITYLPADTGKNAKRFLEVVHPELVIFIKYEYWYHHLSVLAFHHIPALMVSAIFRKQQAFFKWYGGFYRQILFLFRHIFVQDENSVRLLKSHGIKHCSVSGDTRFDRVKKIADGAEQLELISFFVGDARVIVAGSTWPDDEKLIAECVNDLPVKLIIAPHEIHASHIASIQKRFPSSLRYSDLKALIPEKKGSASLWDRINEQQVKDIRIEDYRVLIIDNIGLLSRLYQYAHITYIGGGFNKSGIHNTLEAAVWGKPVIVGPNYKKFREAVELIKEGAAFSISTADELKTRLKDLLNKDDLTQKAGSAALQYVRQQTGASKKVVDYIQENRLLTR